MKKILALLLSILTISVAFVACDNKGVLLQNFPAAYSEEVQLGDTYTLNVISVFDKDNNEYRVTSNVKTTQGDEVNVINNQFDIENIQGYVITYTVKISEKKVATSVLTLTVVDKDGPVIRITKPSDGIVGQEYTLPEITVSDLSGDNITPVIKIYFVNGEEREEIALTDNKFTPAKSGQYLLQVTATDSSNNSNSKEEAFVVYNPALIGEVANFDYAETAKLWTANKGVEISYVSPEQNEDLTYTGGYAQMSFTENNNWVNTYFMPRQAKEAYADFDLMSVWVYPVLKDDVKASCLFSFFNDLNYQVQVNSGEWTKVSFPADKFIASFDNLVNKSQIFLPMNFNNAASLNHANLVSFRLGNIFLHKNADFSVAVDNDNYIKNGDTTTDVTLTVGSENETVPAHVLTVLDSENNAVTAASSEGNAYTYSLTAGIYTYTVTSNDSVYVGSTSGTFSVENSTQIKKDETPTNFTSGTSVTLPDAKIWVDGAVTEEVASKTAKFVYAADNTEEEVLSDTFTPSASGKVVVTYTYTGAVPLTVEYGVTRGAINDRYVLDMSNRDAVLDIDSKKTGFDYAKTYMAGEKNYVAITVKVPVVDASNWIVVPILPKNNMEVLAQYDYVRVEVYYVANADSVVKGLFVSDKHIVTGLKTNQWVNIDIPADLFISSYGIKHLISANYHITNADYPNVTEIRIGNVYGMNDANLSASVDKADIVTGEDTSVNTITVSSTNETMPEYAVIVKNSLGAVMTPASTVDNVYTYNLAAGVYNYEVVSTDADYVGKLSGSFTIEDAMKIMVDNYASFVAGQPISFLDGVIYESGAPTANRAAITAKYIYAIDNSEIVVDTAAPFTPDYSGKLVITYTYEGANDKIVEVIVGRAATKEGYILDATKETKFDLSTSKAATMTYVSAEENTDETYSGGYVLVNNTSSWCNINFSNNVNFTKQDLEGYDYVSIWLYLEYKNTTENNHYISFYNVFEVNGIPTNHALKTNRWVKLNINLDVFEAKFDGLAGKTAKVAFMPFNFSASYLLGVRVGEMKLEKLDSTVNYNTESAKIEMQIADFDGSDYIVSIKNEAGEAVTDFDFVLNKETNLYEYSTTTAGTYTITVVYSYQFVGKTSAGTEVTNTYTVEKTYTVVVNA